MTITGLERETDLPRGGSLRERDEDMSPGSPAVLEVTGPVVVPDCWLCCCWEFPAREALEPSGA